MLSNNATINVQQNIPGEDISQAYNMWIWYPMTTQSIDMVATDRPEITHGNQSQTRA